MVPMTAILFMVWALCLFCSSHSNHKNDMNRDRRRSQMKRTLIILFLLVSVFCAPADAQPCPDGINDITDCPDEGCGDHEFDPELNKQKNIRSDDHEPVLRSIRWMKGLADPMNFTENG